ncbi:unnamed protein product [Toxocara canis]|uniref:PEPCK_N domain-containing protein n=1 Tax=Toxocara canis TaxID=6265 RepID=A0A183UVE7_TOXCA|nr:unnamed protein product [Toxocara canis]
MICGWRLDESAMLLGTPHWRLLWKGHCWRDFNIQGGLTSMPPKVQRFVVEKALLMKPKDIYIVDGSIEQIQEIKKRLIDDKMMFPLKAYENNWIVRTDPKVFFEFDVVVVVVLKVQIIT